MITSATGAQSLSQTRSTSSGAAPTAASGQQDGFTPSGPMDADQIYKGDPALMSSQAKKGDEMLYLALGVAVGCVCCSSKVTVKS